MESFWSECQKIWIRISPNTDTFHAVDMIIIHTSANDIQNKVNVLQKVNKIITTIKKMMLMKYKLLSQVSLTVMIKNLRKKLSKSIESWRVYVRVNELCS